MAKIRATVQPELGLSDAEWETEEAEYFRTWRAAYAPPSGA
jgi:hypothetical protein